jgi:hypothetical protein
MCSNEREEFGPVSLSVYFVTETAELVKGTFWEEGS